PNRNPSRATTTVGSAVSGSEASRTERFSTSSPIPSKRRPGRVPPKASRLTLKATFTVPRSARARSRNTSGNREASCLFLHVRCDALAVLAAIVLRARILVELGAFFHQHERTRVPDRLLVELRVFDRDVPIEVIEVRT